MPAKNLASKAPGSFRDPDGFVFFRDGAPYRQVNHSYRAAYNQLMTSGLYNDLVSEGVLIPHDEVSLDENETAYKILRPKALPFISYPYEWCFSQLKDAAITTLEIQERAMAFGMSLKDASAYNIQFHQGRAIHIDTLSFEKYPDGLPWIAYRQFCEHFLAPLALMAKNDDRLGNLSRVFMDGVPLDLAASLLPLSTRLKAGLLLHVHLHSSSQKKFLRPSARSSGKGIPVMGKAAVLEVIRSLKKAVQELEWRGGLTEWSDYYRDNSYTPDSLLDKGRIVSDMLRRLRPSSVWDLGANEGHFSRLATALGIPTLAFEKDHASVESNYRQAKKNKESYLLPLVLDLANPSPSLGWAHQERSSLLERGPADVCLALALIHHLAISNNLPFENISAFFKRMCKRLILEFVPKSDPQTLRLLAARRDTFPDYSEENLIAAFSRDFIITETALIKDSERKIFAMERRDL